MADPKRAVPENVAGDFFVDTTCINCDTCRQLAPAVFKDAGEHSCVSAQPKNVNEEESALRALVSCPTGSIGTRGTSKAQKVIADFPLKVDGDVYYCGFNSEKSYGANSFFIKHADGNWLIDSPRFIAPLVKAFKTHGGVQYVFLTHRDDVADVAAYASEFKAQRIIHANDLVAQPECEIVISGEDGQDFSRDFKIIPTPGHTRGHMVLLFKNLYLFTGDHLSLEDGKNLCAWHDVCWYSWAKQIESTEKLTKYDFEWVLAGHGNRGHLPVKQMHKELVALIKRMKNIGSKRA